MRYVTAGHIPPIVYRKATNSIERLEQGGTVLGLFDSAPFTEGESQMLPGDILCVFTDGISEAWDDDGEEYGEEYGEDRLAKLVKKNESLSVVELEKLIQSDVETYTKGRPATDNVTVIIVKRL